MRLNPLVGLRQPGLRHELGKELRQKGGAAKALPPGGFVPLANLMSPTTRARGGGAPHAEPAAAGAGAEGGDEWWYKVRDSSAAVGPVDVFEIQLLVDTGTLLPHSLVRASHLRGWTRLEELVGARAPSVRFE